MNFLRFQKVAVLIFFFGLSATAHAQSFDYDSYPRLNFDFSQLQLDVDVNPSEGSLQGSARYNAKARVANLDSLVLQAAHMEILSVRLDNSEADFNLRNDSLFIALGEPSEKDQQYDLAVDYRTMPRFGILQNDRGSLWTSMLSLTHRHWFPVVDHPRISFDCTLTLVVPSGYQAVGSGVKIEEEVTSIEKVRYRYKTRNEIPATSLSFAVGSFDREEVSYGIKKITIDAEKGTLSDSVRQELLASASRVLDQTEQRTGREYPFERLHIVLLQDHFWETKNWGASTIFIYKNGGDLKTQLRRGIYAQWFGVFQREEQWSDAAHINLLQAVLHRKLADSSTKSFPKVSDSPPVDKDNTYRAFELSKWNHFVQQYDSLEVEFKNTVAENISGLIEKGEGVFNSRHYGEYWYEKNGQPVFDLDFSKWKEAGSSGAESDSVIYRVDYREQANGLRLTFNAVKGVFNELVTLPLVKIAPDRTDTLEVTFTGRSDSVSIQVPPMIQNVKILAESKPNLVLQEHKPASYLIYQLRNDNTVEGRATAARQLGYHSDNPDLQLAISDLMNQQLDPRIRAPLLRSFGQITDGASGTASIFLDALRSGNIEIQRAGLFALQNYPEDEQVVGAVRDYATQADSLPVFKDAARIFFSLADSSAQEGFVSSMVQADTAGYKAIFAIRELANAGNLAKAMRQVEFYLSEVYEYPVRSQALKVLFQHERSPEFWEDKARELLQDIDPRIRFLTVRGLAGVEGLDKQELFEVIIQDEYDQRVYQMMHALME